MSMRENYCIGTAAVEKLWQKPKRDAVNRYASLRMTHIYITANVLHYRISWFRSIIVEMTYRQTDTVNLTLTLIPTQTFAMADRLPVYLPFHWSPNC